LALKVIKKTQIKSLSSTSSRNFTGSTNDKISMFKKKIRTVMAVLIWVMVG